MNPFKKEDIIPEEIFSKVTRYRVINPGFILGTARKRKRRLQLTQNGSIHVVAADHPARGSLSVGNNSLAMANRHDLLSRLVQVLRSDWVDGVLSSMDILEELLAIHGIYEEMGTGFLDGKLLIASLNRGGLPGASWELNDVITGTDAKTCTEYGIDACKMLLRIDLKNKDSLKALQYCASGVREMNSIDRPIFLEPLPVEKTESGYTVVHDPDKLIQLISVSAGLGNSSRNTWLKIPFTVDFERVLACTTLPVVILGGGKDTSEKDFLNNLQKSLSSGHQVRGTMIGRNILYPQNSDPLTMAESVGKLVHNNIITSI